MSATVRHNVTVHGPENARPMIFAHGFGCDQAMWRYVWPAFAEDHRVVLFDHIGAGGSDVNAFDPARYATLDAYAQDVLEICAELNLNDVEFVGHSVSSMIGALAAALEPDRFRHLILVGPSPRYIDDEDYAGGFSQADIEDLLDSMDSNYLGWSRAMAPVIMANGEQPELAGELESSFCRADPDIARQFARVTFLSDNREDLGAVKTPSLVMQCSEDVIAPEVVGRYVHEHLANSSLVQLEATGHCPHMSAPGETIAAIRSYLSQA